MVRKGRQMCEGLCEEVQPCVRGNAVAAGVTLLDHVPACKLFSTRKLQFGFFHMQNEGVQTHLVEAI